MPSPRELLPPAPDPTPEAQGLLRGEVTTAPTTLADELVVTVDSRAYEVRYWMPRGAVLPAVGDPCLIAFEDREPWLVAFSPS